MCYWIKIDPANEKTWPPDSGAQVRETMLLNGVWHDRLLSAYVLRQCIVTRQNHRAWYWQHKDPPHSGKEENQNPLLGEYDD